MDKHEPILKTARRRGLVSNSQFARGQEAQQSVKRVLGRPPTMIEVLLIQGVLSESTVLEIRAEIEETQSGPPGDTTRSQNRALFGQVAMELGYITQDQLLTCLGIQQEEAMAGKKPRPLGAVLGSSGMLSKEQIQQVLRVQYGLRDSAVA
ncbi:MAG: hypothetical protein ACYS22_11520 [Planctomycetota bacterium]|jgi:hypothetical protein